ncbi:MAG: hypothetical protein QME81_14890, partial [bacterium]|nr:hypothetical protein [bacterium]
MIRTFKCNETEKIFARQPSRKFPQDIQQVSLRKLRMLNRAATLYTITPQHLRCARECYDCG